MTPFDGIQIFEVQLSQIGNNAMWDAALQILPSDQIDQDHPVVAKATDGNGNQICLTRINGVPTLIETSIPQRLSATALSFQARWQATPIEKQTVTRTST